MKEITTIARLVSANSKPITSQEHKDALTARGWLASQVKATGGFEFTKEVPVMIGETIEECEVLIEEMNKQRVERYRTTALEILNSALERDVNSREYNAGLGMVSGKFTPEITGYRAAIKPLLAKIGKSLEDIEGGMTSEERFSEDTWKAVLMKLLMA